MRVSLTIATVAALAVMLADLVGRSSPVAAQAANETALRAKVTQFIRQHENEAGIPLEKNAKVSTRLVDLNADGTPEALVIIRDANSCGSRGCTAFVLDLSGPTANSIGDLIAETLEALPSRTGQWRDISVNGRRIRFRGGRYGGSAADAGNPKLEPRAQVKTNSADPSSVPTSNRDSPLPTFKDCANCPEMVVLPAGSYWMGATEEDKKIAFADWRTATPRHEVTFDYSFAIGKFEITVAEFGAFVDETGFKTGGECLLIVSSRGPNKGTFLGTISAKADEYQRGILPGGKPGEAALVEFADFRTPGRQVGSTHPATCISWKEAKAYLAWLSAKTGRKYRFPTEAEWEYAARAGETRPYYYGGGQKELCAYGNFGDRDSVYATSRFAKCAENPSLEHTYPVGSLKPNRWGLYDMVGNVFEWVEDCYFPDYNGAPSDGSPWLFSNAHGRYSTVAAGDCKFRASRSYSYVSMDITLRSAARCGYLTDDDGRADASGIRVAVSISSGAWDLRSPH